jgi:hypothetical protein
MMSLTVHTIIEQIKIGGQDTMSEQQLQAYCMISEAPEEAFHRRYLGTCVTHYLHCLFYHHEELHKECAKDGRTLKSYQQEGWKKMNDADRTYIEKHSTKGATVGRKRKVDQITPDLDFKKTMSKSQSYEQLDKLNFEQEYDCIMKLTVAQIRDKLKERGLPTSGVKAELIMRLLVKHQQEMVEEGKQKERMKDPLKYRKWWRASIIVALLQKQARRIELASTKQQ